MKRMTETDWALRLQFATEELRGPLPEAFVKADCEYYAAMAAMGKARAAMDKAARPATAQVRRMVRSILGRSIADLRVRLRVHEDYVRRRDGQPGYGMPEYEIQFSLRSAADVHEKVPLPAVHLRGSLRQPRLVVNQLVRLAAAVRAYNATQGGEQT